LYFTRIPAERFLESFVQASRQKNTAKRIAALCVFALTGATFTASAQHAHGDGMASAKPGKAELGTSAAVDADGRLWIVGKEADQSGHYVVLQSSRDMGKTWSAPKRAQREPESAISADGENRPKIVFGTKGEIYITYTKPLTKPYTANIRFIRSTDGGNTFSAPITVHANRDVITHRFESMIVDKAGRIYVAWIDKRDLEAAAARKEKYSGAALYYAVSDDGGASFRGDYKIADHSCECCRIALALNPAGKPVALWRHVFAPNARDHALVELSADGKAGALARATFDDWRVDACPHQGPSLAYAADGTRHQAWFTGKEDTGGVFYAAADASGALKKPMRLGSELAAHADLAVRGKTVALAWKQFDGTSTAILGKLSDDGGLTWRDREFASTQGASDQPRLLNAGSAILLVWRTQNEGVRTIAVN
jgi:hypothetical protein